MFTATADLESALAILACTALGRPRNLVRLPVEEAQSLLASANGCAALRALAERFALPTGIVPPPATMEKLFDDELLSMRALRLHRGRNVYSAGKQALWNALWGPFRDVLLPDSPTMTLLQELVALHTTAAHPDLEYCADVLCERLGAAGFDVDRRERADHPPILVARRPARGMAGRVVLYGHYDAAETPAEDWATPQWRVAELGGRVYGCAVGDNKAALAVRLAAIARMAKSPELVLLLQGEEECGSPLAHDEFPHLLGAMDATLWLEENGYHDLDGTQRILAGVVRASTFGLGPPDRALDEIATALGRDAAIWGVGARVEPRGLNKDFFPRGCPFQRNLPAGARYLAIGVNDPASGIHRPNESVPVWTFALHARQLATLFREVDGAARRSA